MLDEKGLGVLEIYRITLLSNGGDDSDSSLDSFRDLQNYTTLKLHHIDCL